MALAPDASSMKSGEGLADVREWVTLGCSENAVWGECQGSGKNPYQTRIDLSEPAFKCSCPSRKFPCKHALGLFLLYVKEPRAFAESAPPDWVCEWLASRAKRAEQKVAKAEQKEKQQADPVAQAKRAASREAKVAAGLQELELWLCDLVRGGLVRAQTQPYSFWESMAARMVDAQAPGIARAIKEMASAASSGEGWQERILRRLSQLYLLMEAYRRIDSLPESVQADVRALIGWTQDQDELLKNPGVRDTWLVVGQQLGEDDRLHVQRSWLFGLATRQMALVLNFSPLSQPVIDPGLVPGRCFDSEIVFFPSTNPLRALTKERRDAATHSAPTPLYPSIGVLVQTYQNTLAGSPWLAEFPVIIGDITPVQQDERWFIRDASGDALPIAPHYAQSWGLLSISGGHPIMLFGLWNGEWLLPLSAWSGNRAYFLPVGGNLR